MQSKTSLMSGHLREPRALVRKGSQRLGQKLGTDETASCGGSLQQTVFDFPKMERLNALCAGPVLGWPDRGRVRQGLLGRPGGGLLARPGLGLLRGHARRLPRLVRGPTVL